MCRIFLAFLFALVVPVLGCNRSRHVENSPKAGEDRIVSPSEARRPPKRSSLPDSATLFGVVSDRAPNDKLWEWCRKGGEYENNPEVQQIFAEGLLFVNSESELVDCSNFLLDETLKSAIERAENLRWLRIRIDSEKDVIWLSSLHGLRGLSLMSKEKRDFELDSLRKLDHLQWLQIDLKGTISKLPNPPSLQVLLIHRPGFCDEQTPKETSFQKLRVLKAQYSNLSDTGFAFLPTMCPNLEVLDLYYSRKMTDGSVNEIAKLKKLRFLQAGLTGLRKEWHAVLQSKLPDCYIDTSD